MPTKEVMNQYDRLTQGSNFSRKNEHLYNLD
uniref:Uncharacterized protein n=1 Tax=Rhizophora mucronata TaxID=61149 RepID=A0A2P2QZZ8_RHIMU